MTNRFPGGARAVIAISAVLTVVAAGLVVAERPSTSVSHAAAGCPPGYQAFERFEAEERNLEAEQAEAGDLDPEREREPAACISVKHPEEFAEIARLQAERMAKVAAPLEVPPPGAYRRSLAQRDALQASVPGANGTWTPVGRGPLISNHPAYDNVNGLGLAELNGRIDSLDYDPAADRLFALIGTGGVWMSRDLGVSWRSIGDSLPSQANGALAWSPAGGGTLVVAGGEPLMGGNTYTGLGAFWSNDLGATWHQASGVPDGAMGFQVAVDRSNPKKVYAATSMGLFRSTDAGRNFENVDLPTGGCAGVTGFGRCQFSNFVTDVVVREPGGETNVSGGVVLAAVGYRAGLAEYPNGEIHSTHNGLYRSPTGAPGTFSKLDVSGTGATDAGFAPQQDIGRTELGAATGRRQDHDYVYAIVEDAELFNGGVPSIDAPDDPGADDQALSNTALNGVYVSDDFGKSWTRMADTAEIAENPGTGSSLAGTGQATLFAPGVQAWYNMWVKPDPTRQTPDGVPTRLTFGLEEVWQNRNTSVAQDGTPQDPRGDFKVIGPYFADETCLLLDNPLPACPTSDPVTTTDLTTHPDQHDALYVPDGNGGVSLVVGNDGGAYVQKAARDQEFSPERWGGGNNDGFHTLLPYDAEVARDGTIWYGLQDNGSGKITPTRQRQLMTFGGDGFFVAVDKDNSDVAYSETTFADMRVTTDGGRTWKNIPPPVSNSKFSNPFVMDPRDANHLMTAGQEVVETVSGPDTCDEIAGETVDCKWEQVFDLGTADSPGAPSNSMSALDLQGDAAYVGYCGVCDILGRDPEQEPFLNGLATNVGGDQPPERMTSNGWHHAAAKGLPNRYITSIAIDPRDHGTVYVTLGGYANRQWVPPGSYLDQNQNIGRGHVFRSTDGGETFTDVSGNLPDTPATWVELHGGQLVVGTDIGVFLSSDRRGSEWATLGDGLPVAPISTIRTKPGDARTLVVATFGRGVYQYRFP